MRLFSIVWFSVAVFLLEDGSVAAFSKYVVRANEGSCMFDVQTLVKKHGIAYSKIPKCVQLTTSNFNSLMKSEPTFLPDDGSYERAVYICPVRGSCKDLE